jgi:hypothetical protein
VEDLRVDQKPSGSEDSVDLRERVRYAAEVVVSRAGVMEHDERENHIERGVLEREVKYVCLAEDQRRRRLGSEPPSDRSPGPIELALVKVGGDVSGWLKPFDEPSGQFAVPASDFETHCGSWDGHIGPNPPVLLCGAPRC